MASCCLKRDSYGGYTWLAATRMPLVSPELIPNAVTTVLFVNNGVIAYTGGTGNMIGAAIGTLLISFFQSGLTVVGLDSYYQVVAKGILLIAALTLDYYRERSRIKALNADDEGELAA